MWVDESDRARVNGGGAKIRKDRSNFLLGRVDGDCVDRG